MFSFLKKTKPVSAEQPTAAPQTLVVPPPKPRPDKLLLASYGLRRGMWVVYQNQVGILTDLNVDGVATVMLTDEIGHNRLQILCRGEQLRQAYIQEIPSARQGYVDLRALGYEPQP